jgi:hypothetical protein
MRARAGCTCRLSRIGPAVSTPATPAIAAKEGSQCGGHDARSSRGWRCALLATCGAESARVAGTCFRRPAGPQLRADDRNRGRLSDNGTRGARCGRWRLSVGGY